MAGEVVNVTTDLERGRRFYARRAWADAHESLVAADRAAPLSAGDLELLATAAYMLGRDDGYFSALERAHRESDARGRAGSNELLDASSRPE